MKKGILTRPGRFSVPYWSSIPEGAAQVCLVIHGFGGSKGGATATMLHRELPKLGLGVFSFDLPAHGESEAGGEALTVENCLEEIRDVRRAVEQLAPGAEMVYFGSSFGAYLTLLELSSRPSAGVRAFLRSAAVEMPQLMEGAIPNWRALTEGGQVIPFDRGYQRPLELHRACFESLLAHPLEDCWQDTGARLCMVHGGKDVVASPAAAESFARRSGAAFTMIPGGDHQLSIPGAPEQVLELAAAFFTAPRQGEQG